MNFIGLIFIMLVKGNAQDVPNDKETNRGGGGGGGLGLGRQKYRGGGVATEKKNRVAAKKRGGGF